VTATPSKSIRAAIDVGSNSVHLLTARIKRPRSQAGGLGTLTTIDDRSDLIGLGDVVHAKGHVPVQQLQEVIDSLMTMRNAARDAGASDIVVIGTEPLRRASNSQELITAVSRFLGMPMHVLTERQEAELTFIGVTAGKPLGQALAVADIGGGSTELSLYMPDRPLEVVPLRIGSARLTNSRVRNDPPTWPEIDTLIATARDAVAAAEWPPIEPGMIVNAIFVGGTATNIARMGRLDRTHLEEDLATLAKVPADEVVSLFGVRPRRARQLAAGVAIVRAILERLNLPEAEVSDASLRDGAILARASYGDDWLEALSNQTRNGSSAARSA
jgi:exopolyphosphatase/guanosine-5'-triphosphate,3'-diphosphate pyrophosphatase